MTIMTTTDIVAPSMPVIILTQATYPNPYDITEPIDTVDNTAANKS